MNASRGAGTRAAIDNFLDEAEFYSGALTRAVPELHGKAGVDKNGWKLCHISGVGLNSRLSLEDVALAELKTKFVNLLSPSNYFLLPMAWGGLGEAVEFIRGFQKHPGQPTWRTSITARH